MRDPADAWRPQMYPCRTSRAPSVGRGDAAVAEYDRIYASEYLTIQHLDQLGLVDDLHAELAGFGQLAAGVLSGHQVGGLP